jgi:hypothetical protein
VIVEVAGAVKDLIKAGRVMQFGMSEAAPGTIWQPKEHRGPSDQQADGDVDTAAPTQAARLGSVSGGVRLARSGADRVFGTAAGCRCASDYVRCVLPVVR